MHLATPTRTRVLAVGAAALTLLVAAALAACGSSSSSPSPSPAATPMQLKVMEFNIEYGGTQVSFAKVAEAVKKADPDVVGLEEAETNTPRLAKLAGYPYFSSGMQIVSRYPILEPSGAEGAYVLIEVQPGYVVAISNVHLPSAPYGPNWIRAGRTVDQVVALENKVRMPAIQQQVEVLPKLATKGIPVFVTGDFNAPSHLDYTAAAVGTRKEVKYVVDWPVSQAMADAGLRDSYRDAHPDPVADPGLTWWAARPKVADWNPTARDPQDRIDYVYAAGPSKTLSSEIVGEVGDPAVSISVSPWPSDHRAVLSTFTVTPGPMPVLVAPEKLLVTAGEPLVVTYHSPGKGGETVVIGNAGQSTASGAPAVSQAAGAADGKLSFATDSLLPGAYSVALLGGDGQELASAPFWLKAKGAKVQLKTDKPTYAPGEPIVVSWQNAPANRWDWLGVYKAPADPANDYYLIWQYTGGASAGTVHGMPAGTLAMDGKTTEGSPWPLPPGKYQVLYLLADAYESVARASFTVEK